MRNDVVNMLSLQGEIETLRAVVAEQEATINAFKVRVESQRRTVADFRNARDEAVVKREAALAEVQELQLKISKQEVEIEDLTSKLNESYSQGSWQSDTHLKQD